LGVRSNPGNRVNASKGRYSDLLPGGKRLPKRMFSDRCLRLQGQFTAAGLYGIFARFPIKRRAWRTNCCCKVTKNIWVKHGLEY